MKPSRNDLVRMINRNGARCGLASMTTPFGQVVVGEDVPVAIPIAPGLSVVVKVRRDITAISEDYPWSRLAFNKQATQTEARHLALRYEVAVESWRKDAERRIADAKHELVRDLGHLHADRKIVMLGSNHDAHSRTSSHRRR